METPPRFPIPRIPAHAKRRRTKPESDSDSSNSDKGKAVVEEKKKRRKKIGQILWMEWMVDVDKWIDANKQKDIGLDFQNEEFPETAETPPDLVLPLLRYQKEWLAWASKQEESEFRGGILADEMGMGKTIQAIALVLAKRANNNQSSEIKATLVICPLVAVTQWLSEISKFTPEGRVKVLVYQGLNKGKTRNDLSDYDFVLTTYPTIGMEYRKYMMPPKESTKQSKVGKKDQGSSARVSILYSVKWDRVILDEAHCIKNIRSNIAKAVLALESSYKWALTASPLQNNLWELYSLVRFLQAYPYSYNFCKICNCKLFDSSCCSKCDHGSIHHFNWWKRFISVPIQRSRDDDKRIRALTLLNCKVLKSVMLRRTKEGRAADLGLPPRTVTLRLDELDDKEKDFYDALYKRSQLKFNIHVEELNSNYFDVFQTLIRLRQAVNHPYLVICSETTTLKRESNIENDEDCDICNDLAEDPVVTSCKHVFCKACLKNYSKAWGKFSCTPCPSCSRLLTADFTTKTNIGDHGNKTPIKGFLSSSILNELNLEYFQTSTKIDALKEEIRFMFERDGSAKAIVFSEFVPFLDLICYSLQKSGVECAQLLGRMSKAARNDAIRRFTDDPDCRIFILSLKAGFATLNLTVASHVFLMEPFWNPALERQAMDRIHRIGQYKPTRVVKFIIQNTVEERILKMQENKEGLFEGTIGGSSDALAKLEENRFLPDRALLSLWELLRT